MGKRLSWSAALGATKPAGDEELTFFIPEKDRDGRPIDQKAWTKALLTLLGRLLRGGTAYPPGLGVWRDDERGGRLLFERTVIVTCYAVHAELVQAVPHLRSFLHHFGRAANQGEVGMVIGGAYRGITLYDTQSDS